MAFRFEPFVDIGRAILQRDPVGSASGKKSDCVPVHVTHLLQVNRHVRTPSFSIEDALQFRQIAFLNTAVEGQNRGTLVVRSDDLKHLAKVECKRVANSNTWKTQIVTGSAKSRCSGLVNGIVKALHELREIAVRAREVLDPFEFALVDAQCLDF